ncbi:MAG TPA: isoaspartyl peptidase/L-asparaginase [Candidatus Angelobacter sp.]
MKAAIVVQGGCGPVPEPERPQRDAICESATQLGFRILQKGGTALDACEAAVIALEDSLVLNAGLGSYRQADGMVRRDASIMTSDLRAGSIAQVPFLKNPIRLARYLLEQDAHIMLTGHEAFHLGLRLGLDCCFTATDAKNRYWKDHLTDACLSLDYAAMATEWKAANPRLGTVGCVCIDREGHLAAGTSTGGTGQVYPGRVGDTPIIGAGTYCMSQAAVSMTGTGERIMVHLSAKTLCDYVKMAKELDEAARLVLAELQQECKGSAGLIALDSKGRTISVKNTAYMATAERRE